MKKFNYFAAFLFFLVGAIAFGTGVYNLPAFFEYGLVGLFIGIICFSLGTFQIIMQKKAEKKIREEAEELIKKVENELKKAS